MVMGILCSSFIQQYIRFFLNSWARDVFLGSLCCVFQGLSIDVSHTGNALSGHEKQQIRSSRNIETAALELTNSLVNAHQRLLGPP